jgi:hypothetical protein
MTMSIVIETEHNEKLVKNRSDCQPLSLCCVKDDPHKGKPTKVQYNSMLMTKFGKSEKIGLSGLPFRNIRFWQFQNKIKEGARLEDLKIQDVLRQENGLKEIKGPRYKKIKQEAEVAKTKPSDLPNRTIRFSQNRYCPSRI